ncbi:single-stranded DNA-binding protein [Sphingobacterium haloxyli]|uniref:Single-stranded DNA-binding protein n=1 Tax=Sphingobacterium haloxyli TaxID=2100533 RepID=A0A2S9J2X0_9SPHI|nr:single-stranded DNA-binding protein [Sphingobacterium haloxyli]PRD47133.1 single-stranded DNA-binding protein [Sphingobacterium haloxyli]
MSTLINAVQLIGRLGADVEMKTTTNGTKVSNVRLATNEYSKNSQGEWVETTYWHSLVFWGKLAEKLERRGKKGTRLLVQGSLLYRDYIDVNNIKREVTDIRVHQFIVLDSQAANTSLLEVSSDAEEDTDHLP